MVSDHKKYYRTQKPTTARLRIKSLATWLYS